MKREQQHLPIAYQDGYNWYNAGGKHDNNPYFPENLYQSWSAGYMKAQQEKLEEQTRRIAA